MKIKSRIAALISMFAGSGIVGAVLFLHLGPACACLGFESQMAIRADYPLKNGTAHSRDHIIQALPRGSSIMAARSFITNGHEPLERDAVLRYQQDEQHTSELPDDYTWRLWARKNYDKFCVETLSKIACRFETERYLFGTSGFDLTFTLGADLRVTDVRVDVHSWWQGSPAPLALS